MSIAPDNVTHHSRAVFAWKVALAVLFAVLATIALSGALDLPFAGM